MLCHDMALMDLTYVVKQTCQKSHFWPFYSKKVHVCHCKANGFFLMSTRTVRPLLDMDLPIKEALPRADAHITCYHHLLALVQAEQFFEPAGASVKAKVWLAWAHFVCWVLVGYTQPRSSMLLTLLAALPVELSIFGVIR